MGNSIGKGKKKAKVMKINGEILKFKTPLIAMDVVKDYPGHVLLESEAVKKYGIRAKPLDSEEELKPKKIYFLVELPKLPDDHQVPRRVRSAVHVSAKDRLDMLMLQRRSASDLSVSRSRSGPFQVKMKLPRSQVQKLIEESIDEEDVADKIINLCLQNRSEKPGKSIAR